MKRYATTLLKRGKNTSAKRRPPLSAINMSYKPVSNVPLDDTPKSDRWYITKIEPEPTPNILEQRFTDGYIRKTEKLFAETILFTTRDILTYNSFVRKLYQLFYANYICTLYELLYPHVETQSMSTRSSIGGTNGTSTLNNELAYQSTDTQHDFKPGRNKVYPKSIERQGAKKEPGLEVYNKLNSVIGNTPQYGNDYIMSSPIAFEENIKVDYLIGDLVEPPEDMYYYFTDITETPSTWISKRKQFFGVQSADNVRVNSINTLVKDVAARNYRGWVLDACMSGRVNRALGERKKTLANIWDPVKGTFQFTDLVDTTEKAVLTISHTDTYQGYDIYDCIINSSNESLYDVVYEPLLNKDVSEVLNIKLRLAEGSNGKCGVAIIITIGKDTETIGKNTENFVIKGGFSVQELAHGMRYIDDKYSASPYSNVNTTLKEIIDYE
jgi:hypothetical protein